MYERGCDMWVQQSGVSHHIAFQKLPGASKKLPKLPRNFQKLPGASQKRRGRKKTRPNTAHVIYEQEEAGMGVREGRYPFEESEKQVSEGKKEKQVSELGKNVLC